MRNRRFMESRVSVIAVAVIILLGFFPGSILSAVVTLESVKLYDTHSLTEKKPRVFFQCAGENKIFLPDKGEEYWQPLTKLEPKECKKCGIYEDLLPSDHAFNGWDLCSSNFTVSDGRCTIFEGGIMATFVCQECSPLKGVTGPRRIMKSEKSDEQKSHFIPIMITIVLGILAIVASMALYKWWQKKKRQRDQARFMRLFEEDDDIEDELGLKDMF